MRKNALRILAVITLLCVTGGVLAIQDQLSLALALLYVVLLLIILVIFQCTRWIINHVLSTLSKSRTDTEYFIAQFNQKNDQLEKQINDQSKELSLERQALKSDIQQSIVILEQHAARLLEAEDTATQQLGRQIEEALRANRVTLHSTANRILSELRQTEDRIKKSIADE